MLTGKNVAGKLYHKVANRGTKENICKERKLQNTARVTHKKERKK
jgi:hypothetical protein